MNTVIYKKYEIQCDGLKVIISCPTEEQAKNYFLELVPGTKPEEIKIKDLHEEEQ